MIALDSLPAWFVFHLSPILKFSHLSPSYITFDFATHESCMLIQILANEWVAWAWPNQQSPQAVRNEMTFTDVEALCRIVVGHRPPYERSQLWSSWSLEWLSFYAKASGSSKSSWTSRRFCKAKFYARVEIITSIMVHNVPVLSLLLSLLSQFF